jgi:hypothetical protein
LKTIEQLRRSFPKTVNAETLKKLGIAPQNESYIINVLRFIGVIDDAIVVPIVSWRQTAVRDASASGVDQWLIPAIGWSASRASFRFADWGSSRSHLWPEINAGEPRAIAAARSPPKAPQ